MTAVFNCTMYIVHDVLIGVWCSLARRMTTGPDVRIARYSPTLEVQGAISKAGFEPIYDLESVVRIICNLLCVQEVVTHFI